MGLFDFFKKEPKTPPKETARPAPAEPKVWPQLEYPLLEIAAIISDGDKHVLEGVRSCLKNPVEYALEHYERYLYRGIDPSDGDFELIEWIALVEELQMEGYVCERDWKDEKPDFVHFLQSRKGMKRLGLTLDPKWLDRKGDVAGWCETINRHWAAQNCCVAAIGINSDSYVLFPCTLAERDRLGALAKQLGECIE